MTGAPGSARTQRHAMLRQMRRTHSTGLEPDQTRPDQTSGSGESRWRISHCRHQGLCAGPVIRRRPFYPTIHPSIHPTIHPPASFDAQNSFLMGYIVGLVGTPMRGLRLQPGGGCTYTCGIFSASLICPGYLRVPAGYQPRVNS